MMVDILKRYMIPTCFGLSGPVQSPGFADPLTRRSEPGEQAAAIDDTDVQTPERHDVVLERYRAHNANSASTKASAAIRDKLAFPI